MKILIVKLTPIESTDSATIRTLGLANGLLRNNCSVDYLTIPTSTCHVTAKDRNFIEKLSIIRTSGNLVYDSVNIQKGRLKGIIVSILRKVYHTISLYDYTYSIAKNIDISLLNNSKYDLVISSSDPVTSHIAVLNLIKKGLSFNSWIQYWGDPLALDITRKSAYPKWFIAKIEKSILASADSIVYVSPFTLEEQKKLFPGISGKMSFLPIPYIREKIFGETNNVKFRIGYFGAYSSDVRNILPLYNACIKMNKSVDLDIVGDSDLKLEQTDNINTYLRGDISEFEKNTDLFICLLNRRGSQIPGKIYHSAATNRPVLIILDGDKIEEMRIYFQSFDRFCTCENNEDSIISAIGSIMIEKKQYKPATQISPETIARNFLDLAR